MSSNPHIKKLYFTLCSCLFILCTNGFSQIAQPNFIEDFTAEKLNNNVKLKWAVNSEVNIENYTIDRSIDGLVFIHLLSQNNHGNSGNSATYVAFDNTPLEGPSFYRVSSLDVNGDTAFTKTIVFNNYYLSEDLPIFNMYPNPIRGEELTIEFVALLLESSQVIITDINGKTIHQSRIVSDIISLDLNLPRGVYLVSVLSPSDRLTKKLIVD